MHGVLALHLLEKRALVEAESHCRHRKGRARLLYDRRSCEGLYMNAMALVACTDTIGGRAVMRDFAVAMGGARRFGGPDMGPDRCVNCRVDSRKSCCSNCLRPFWPSLKWEAAVAGQSTRPLGLWR